MIAMLFIPVGCASRKMMQLIFTKATTRFAAHGFGKKRVTPIPLPGCAKRFEKQVGPFQQREHVLAVLLFGHSVTQGSRQTSEDTGLEQKLLHPFGLQVKHFGDKVLL